jgi:hypothetical protein
MPVLFFIAMALAATLAAQEPPKSGIAPNDEFIHKQFGASCSLNSTVAPIAADLNGDGIQDIVIPARCKDPMMDAGDNHYVVLDPYNAFYGFGDPRVTTQFATADPANRDLMLLIIHGAGPQGWRADEPKEKFLIVNLPYKQIQVKRLSLNKKKSVMAVYSIESGQDQMTSAIFWDGKKYKYQPMGSSMQ